MRIYHAAMRTLAVLLVALFVATPVLAATSNSSSHPTASNDSGQQLTNVLTLSPKTVKQTNTTVSTSNMSATLSLGTDRVGRQLAIESKRAQLNQIHDPQKKRAAIKRSVVEVSIATDNLKSREKEAFKLHNEGRLSTKGLLVRLARIDATAKRLSANATMLGQEASNFDDFSQTQNRIGVIRTQLRTLRGPVRHHVARVIAGDAPPTRIYVSTANDGVLLSTIINGTYVREVYDGSRRTTNSDSKIPISQLQAIIQKDYPTLWSRGSGGFSSSDQVQASYIFVAELTYGRGNLTAFVDRRGNGNVFEETQSRSLDRAPPTKPMTDTEANLKLTVSPSYPGGPMLVSLENARTGAPVQANVTFTTGGSRTHLIGRTNVNGQLWTVMPNGSVTVRAIHRNIHVVSVRAKPVATPTVGSDSGNNSTAANGSTAHNASPALAPSVPTGTLTLGA